MNTSSSSDKGKSKSLRMIFRSTEIKHLLKTRRCLIIRSRLLNFRGKLDWTNRNNKKQLLGSKKRISGKFKDFRSNWQRLDVLSKRLEGRTTNWTIEFNKLIYVPFQIKKEFKTSKSRKRKWEWIWKDNFLSKCFKLVTWSNTREWAHHQIMKNKLGSYKML